MLLVSLGWVGHAAEGKGRPGSSIRSSRWCILLTAALWLGGLLPLAWLLGRARSLSGAAWIPVERDVVPRFPQMGYVAVALLAATGSLNSLLLVGSTQALAGTPYCPVLGAEDPVVSGDGRRRAL